LSNKNKLEDALVEIINKDNNGIDSATDFLSAEIPDVIHQLLLWHGIYSFTLFLVSVVIVLSAPYQVKKIKSLIPEKIKEGDDDNWFWHDSNRSYKPLGFSVKQTEAAFVFWIAVCVVSLIQVTLVVKLLNLEWLKIWIAPKVWLLEYASNLIS